ncbi:MAG: D-alanine--D-alanine ligase [Candidatus Brocadiaceae bacterium]|nr:D-alanine--D-alanine ligase [Candidatus Brocadiaceae bacterium]
MKPKSIGVLMGGISAEREISLRSGMAVAKALKKLGFHVTCFDVRDKTIEELDVAQLDLVFVALHGYFGEDGGVQHLLELKGIPYTGSGIRASRLAMDKSAAKKCFVQIGLSTPDYRMVRDCQKFKEITSEVNELGLPIVLKPTGAGSSLGVSIIKNIDELKTGLEKAFEYGTEVLIEKYISGREFTVGILGGEALPIIEIIPTKGFFNYNAKYEDGGVNHCMVQNSGKESSHGDSSCLGKGTLSHSKYNEAQELALRAHRVLECRDFSRVDMLMDNKDNFSILEVNTIPGFTEKSLLPLAAKAANISFLSLCKKIVDLALQNSFVKMNESAKK